MTGPNFIERSGPAGRFEVHELVRSGATKSGRIPGAGVRAGNGQALVVQPYRLVRSRRRKGFPLRLPRGACDIFGAGSHKAPLHQGAKGPRTGHGTSIFEFGWRWREVIAEFRHNRSLTVAALKR